MSAAPEIVAAITAGPNVAVEPWTGRRRGSSKGLMAAFRSVPTAPKPPVVSGDLAWTDDPPIPSNRKKRLPGPFHGFARGSSPPLFV
jgi:hypothetical protein